MKTLYLARHAKSSWKVQGLTDFERPLNEKGNKTAPFMGALLKKLNAVPERIVTSTAVRALSTAQYFAHEFGYSQQEIELKQELYLANVINIIQIVQKFDDSYNSAMVVAHNPGISDTASLLTGGFPEDMPTAAVVALTFDVDEWKAVEVGKGKILFYEFPKKHKQ